MGLEIVYKETPCRVLQGVSLIHEELFVKLFVNIFVKLFVKVDKIKFLLSRFLER